MNKNNFQHLGEIFDKKKPSKKPPAFEWQELALKIINELGVPNLKRNSVFKICKEYPKNKVLAALNDTKELCKSGEKWKYFFKVLNNFS